MIIPKAGNPSSPRQHYLPAAVIGRFASGPTLTAARDRRVWVLRRNGTIAMHAAASLAYQNNLYDAGADFNIDNLWVHYEQNVNPAIDALLWQFPGPYQIDSWAHVATYIASNFARTPDFPAQLNRRFGHTPGGVLDHILTRENANRVRFLENFRVSAAVARAHWRILHSPTHPLILNDRGATAMYDPRRKALGYVIPLRPNLAAMLSRGPYDKPILWLDGTWRIDLADGILGDDQAHSLNIATWAQCRREVYASTGDELRQLKQHRPSVDFPAIADAFDGAGHLGLSHSQRMESETLLQQILLEGIPAPADPTRSPLLKI